MEMNKQLIGARFKEARNKKGYTVEELAEMVDISPVYIRHIEAGMKLPSLKVFNKLVVTLETSSDYILRGNSNVNNAIISELELRMRNLTDDDLEIVYDILETVLKHMNKK